jgi:hypothetical protein
MTLQCRVQCAFRPKTTCVWLFVVQDGNGRSVSFDFRDASWAFPLLTLLPARQAVSEKYGIGRAFSTNGVDLLLLLTACRLARLHSHACCCMPCYR